MKFAIISDIHSNFFYLEQIFTFIEKEQVDEIYCLGDIVGYYDEPNEVIEFIIKKNIKAVKGNHEKYLLGEISYNQDKDRIYRLNEQKKIIKNEYIEFLKYLPCSIKKNIGLKIMLTHSLPDDSEKYIYDFSKISKDIISNYDVYIFGHTHIPLITCNKGVYILNPGSVGQPRDWSAMPSYLIIETNQLMFSLKKVFIDNQKYLVRLQKKGFNKEAIYILARSNYYEKS